MSTAPQPMSRIAETLRSLADRFQKKLSGSRQASRSELVDFLARELGVTRESATRLFDDLSKAGVIRRHDTWLGDGEQAVDPDQPWAIRTESAEPWEPDFELVADSTDRAPREPESPALDLIRRAIARRATDVHLDPFDDETEVRFRIDGRLEHFCRLSAEIGRHVVSQLKVTAGLNPTEPFRSHTTRLEMPLGLSEYDVRLTTTPVCGGESVAVRLLGRDQIIRPVDRLGLSTDPLGRLDRALAAGEGVVLIGGPSGAGKTTTAYSLLHRFDDGHRKIVTIEDPVEYRVPSFAQVEIDLRHDVSPAAGLTTVMRMDSDVILIGEIRDEAMAATAMRAASSGRYVFSTIHARDAASIVTSLRALGVGARATADNLQCLVAQRLVRRICESCRTFRPLEEREKKMFQEETLEAPRQMPQAAGCDRCGGRGYRDRLGIFEIAAVTPEVAAAVEAGRSERELRRLFRAQGVPSLTVDGLRKVIDGLTTHEEVWRACRPGRFAEATAEG